MSCSSCKEIQKEDKVKPDCKYKRRGCPILFDKLDHTAGRAITIRNALVKGSETVGHAAIHSRYKTTAEELDLIIAIEDELRKIEAEKKERDG